MIKGPIYSVDITNLNYMSLETALQYMEIKAIKLLKLKSINK